MVDCATDLGRYKPPLSPLGLILACLPPRAAALSASTCTCDIPAMDQRERSARREAAGAAYLDAGRGEGGRAALAGGPDQGLAGQSVSVEGQEQGVGINYSTGPLILEKESLD